MIGLNSTNARRRLRVQGCCCPGWKARLASLGPGRVQGSRARLQLAARADSGGRPAGQGPAEGAHSAAWARAASSGP